MKSELKKHVVNAMLWWVDDILIFPKVIIVTLKNVCSVYMVILVNKPVWEPISQLILVGAAPVNRR